MCTQMIQVHSYIQGVVICIRKTTTTYYCQQQTIVRVVRKHTHTHTHKHIHIAECELSFIGKEEEESSTYGEKRENDNVKFKPLLC